MESVSDRGRKSSGQGNWLSDLIAFQHQSVTFLLQGAAFGVPLSGWGCVAFESSSKKRHSTAPRAWLAFNGPWLGDRRDPVDGSRDINKGRQYSPLLKGSKRS